VLVGGAAEDAVAGVDGRGVATGVDGGHVVARPAGVAEIVAEAVPQAGVLSGLPSKSVPSRRQKRLTADSRSKAVMPYV
jgi:hypothetical protein